MGQVRRVGSTVCLRPVPVGPGYSQVTLVRDGKRRSAYVHRLVLEAFVGPPPPGQVARYRNGDRNDLRLANLFWGSNVGHISQRRVISPELREAIRVARASGESAAATAVRLGVSASTVLRWGGERKRGSPRKRLDAATVDAIRTRLEAGAGLRATAREFGVSPPTVANIRDGVTHP